MRVSSRQASEEYRRMASAASRGQPSSTRFIERVYTNLERRITDQTQILFCSFLMARTTETLVQRVMSLKGGFDSSAR
jgi:hypothetical protein